VIVDGILNREFVITGEALHCTEINNFFRHSLQEETQVEYVDVRWQMTP